MKTKTTEAQLSLVIPANNEEVNIANTVKAFHKILLTNKLPHEIVVIDDHSSDNTYKIINKLKRKVNTLRVVPNSHPKGYGFAVRKGLEIFRGNYVAIVMADLSDDPHDLVIMYHKALEGYDCVFGSRFMKDVRVIGYPLHKLILNRMANNLLRILFFVRYNDITNAFKLFSRETIDGIKPFLSHHFNLTVELPLKAISRGYSYTVVPTNWTNRKAGISKLKIKEMGSRYLFIILYCFIEKIFSMRDYHKDKKDS